MNIPENLPIEKDEKKLLGIKKTINFLLQVERDRQPDGEPAVWSNTEPKKAIEYGEVKEVEGTNLVDVFDGSGYQRMTKAYYDEHFGGKPKVVEPKKEENEV